MFLNEQKKHLKKKENKPLKIGKQTYSYTKLHENWERFFIPEAWIFGKKYHKFNLLEAPSPRANPFLSSSI